MLRKQFFEVENLVYYYPISPKIAITVNDNNIDDKLELLKEQVEEYNQKLINASYEFVFADNEMYKIPLYQYSMLLR